MIDALRALLSPLHRYFSREECLMGRDREYPLSPELERNLETLLTRLNKFRKLYGKPMYISSLYRPGHYNAKVGGSKNSAHLYCMAVDLKDARGEIKAWIAARPSLLEELDLYMEHPSATPTWVHLQTRPTSSGGRVFRP